MSTQTSNKNLTLPAFGDSNWNSPVNNDFTYVDQALGSYFSVSVGTGGTTALTTSTVIDPVTGAYWWTAQQLDVTASGNLTSNAVITIPSSLGTGTLGGAWVVKNSLTSTQQGSYTLTIKTASGTGVTVAQGTSAYVYSNGTNVYYTDDNLTSTLAAPSFNTLQVLGSTALNTTSSRTTVGTPSSQSATISIASPAVVTLSSATPLPATGTPVYFTTTGTLPTGLNTGQVYYVIFPSAGTFQLSATPSGSAINTSATQSGTHTVNFGVGSQLYSASQTTPAIAFPNAAEVAVYTATAATGTINYDLINQSILYYTSNSSANWTINFRGNSSTTLNSMLQVGQAITATFLATNGSTAYYNSSVQIDSVGQTLKWQNIAPSAGNASAIDVYSYTIIKTATTPTYTVLASISPFV